MFILPSLRLGHLAEEVGHEVVSEIVWDVVDVAWEQVYHNWVQKEIFPYAVEDARKKLLQSIAVRSNALLVTHLHTNTPSPTHQHILHTNPNHTYIRTYTHPPIHTQCRHLHAQGQE